MNEAREKKREQKGSLLRGIRGKRGITDSVIILGEGKKPILSVLKRGKGRKVSNGFLGGNRNKNPEGLLHI